MRQPLDHTSAHSRNNLMRGIITLKHNRARSRFQLCFIILYSFRRVKLVACSGKMQHVNLRLPVHSACLPISGDTATNTDYSPQPVRMGKSKPVIECAGLREAKKEDACRIGDAFASQDFN